jgi:hypothetical protein
VSSAPDITAVPLDPPSSGPEGAHANLAPTFDGQSDSGENPLPHLARENEKPLSSIKDGSPAAVDEHAEQPQSKSAIIDHLSSPPSSLEAPQESQPFMEEIQKPVPSTETGTMVLDADESGPSAQEKEVITEDLSPLVPSSEVNPDQVEEPRLRAREESKTGSSSEPSHPIASPESPELHQAVSRAPHESMHERQDPEQIVAEEPAIVDPNSSLVDAVTTETASSTHDPAAAAKNISMGPASPSGEKPVAAHHDSRIGLGRVFRDRSLLRS